MCGSWDVGILPCDGTFLIIFSLLRFPPSPLSPPLQLIVWLFSCILRRRNWLLGWFVLFLEAWATYSSSTVSRVFNQFERLGFKNKRQSMFFISKGRGAFGAQCLSSGPFADAVSPGGGLRTVRPPREGSLHLLLKRWEGARPFIAERMCSSHGQPSPVKPGKRGRVWWSVIFRIPHEELALRTNGRFDR